MFAEETQKALPNHEVSTVPEAGWASKKNGELLQLMSNVFEVFITVDSNMQNQQKLATMPIRFIVLSAKNNKLETLLPLIPAVESALNDIQEGEVRIISEDDIEKE